MITQIELSRFRGHTATYKFGPGKNLIKGKNEAGKTSIKEAIAFALMGTDSEGAKSPDHLISVDSDITEVAITTPKSTVRRRKKRGATSEIKLQRPGIPDIKVSQTDIMGQIGISQEVFMSSWLAGYFMRLKPEARLKALGEIANIDRKALIHTLVPEGSLPSIVKLINPRIDADAVAGLRRQEQNKRVAAEASKRTLMASVQSPINMTEEEFRNKNAYMVTLTESIADHEVYQRLAQQYKSDIERREQAAKMGAELVSAVDECQIESQRLGLEENELSHTSQNWYTERENLKKKIEPLRNKKLAVTMAPPKKPSLIEGICATCVGKLTGDYESALMNYNKHEREVANHNQQVDSELQELTKKYEAADGNYQSFVRKLEGVRGQKKSLDANLSRLREQLNAAPKEQRIVTVPNVPKGDLSVFRAEKEKVAAELHAYNVYRTQVDGVAQQVAALDTELSRHDKAIAHYGTVEMALNALPKMETEKTLEKVSIPGVEMKLVDGEFIVTDGKGVDYRCLSDGRRMKVDMALAVAIKRAAGPAAPPWLFVDNADLMDSQIEIPDGMQVLIAQVDPDADEVKVVQL